MAFELGVDPSRISRAEHDEHPSMHLVERISTVYSVDAFAWLNEEAEPAEQQGASTLRIAHRASVLPSAPDDAETNWRRQAVDLLARMTDLLESLLRGSRGGGGKLALMSISPIA